MFPNKNILAASPGLRSVDMADVGTVDFASLDVDFAIGWPPLGEQESRTMLLCPSRLGVLMSSLGVLSNIHGFSNIIWVREKKVQTGRTSRFQPVG